MLGKSRKAQKRRCRIADDKVSGGLKQPSELRGGRENELNKKENAGREGGELKGTSLAQNNGSVGARKLDQ